MTWHALYTTGGDSVDAWEVEARDTTRRDVELHRATDDFRRVRLRYPDGATELVVVAHRERYDAAALSELAEGGSPAPAHQPIPRATPSTPDWGLPAGGPPGTFELLTEPGDAADWAKALDIVLAVYGGDAATLRFVPDELPGRYLPCLAPDAAVTLSVFRDSRGWVLRCDYLADHVHPAMAEQFTRHLHSAHATGEMMNAAERERIAGLGRTAAPAGFSLTIPQAFRRTAAAAPDAKALGDMTYRELDERSDALARGLVAKGVKRGDRVGVCLERGPELVVTLLAVMKAGAAYVPMDPAYPLQRLDFTVEDAGLDVVISRSYPGVSPDELIEDADLPTTDPSDAAYVIYTSGSTGRPKGVIVPHRNVIALMDATRDTYGLSDADVWTWFHSAAFDFSVWEIWGCLLTGGRIVPVPYLVSREPEAFRDLLVDEQVTVLSQTPSAFAQLLATEHQAARVRLVVFGGESLDTRMLLPWQDWHPACELVNMFGITETTVHVTARTITRALALAGSRSVGPALAGWHLYVADTAGALLPPGVAGEIVVGGSGVADGYLNREELTAQRFRPDPYGEGCVYHSGDLGRLRPDGTLDHLGRIDSQVKLRGFRIELDEIRSVLLEDPAVRAAAVVLRQGDPTDATTARLDAYVVLNSGSSAEVRARAATVLPEHMVPSAVTGVDALPLTPNGKLDVTRLPAPPAVHVEEGGDLTSRLRGIWSSVLGIEVGVDDDFFDLGGNSLLAVRLGSAMRAGGLPDVRLRDLYRHPTISSLLASFS
ncbi:amino acid adenylation domain-containing protein [Kribbella sp. NPDC051587]|uniref:amino acid adenylation domain-containing protein n=1 Tax=Kribbella sp. NPDC051587 TaxID=3364119 RepID=UPI0037ABEC7D